MKRLLLILIFLLTSFAPSYKAEASGSNTVFLPVRLTDYKFTKAVSDNYFNTSELFNYLESSQNNTVMVARVNAYVYRMTYYYTYWGYDMDLGFQQYEIVNFKYYPRFGAILGLTSQSELVVLLPQVPSLPSIGTEILLDF